MKYRLTGVLLGLIVLCCPITVHAESVHQRTHFEALDISYEEAQTLLKIATAEAGCEGSDGMWLVMSTIINRVNDPAFPDTIHDVVYQPYQYYTKGMDKAVVTPEAHEALARLETGDIAREVVAFETVNSNALDNYFTEVFTYRNHCFYVPKQ